MALKNNQKQKREFWVSVQYLCPICDNDILQKIKVFETFYGSARYENGWLNQRKIAIPNYVYTNHYKCGTCGMPYLGTLFLKNKPLSEAQLSFKKWAEDLKKKKDHPS